MTIITFPETGEVPATVEVRCPACGTITTYPYKECTRHSDICLACTRRYSVHFFASGMIVVE